MTAIIITWDADFLANFEMRSEEHLLSYKLENEGMRWNKRKIICDLGGILVWACILTMVRHRVGTQSVSISLK